MTDRKVHYRLRGEVGGAARSYALRPGENSVGSVAGNAIVLRQNRSAAETAIPRPRTGATLNPNRETDWLPALAGSGHGADHRAQWY